VGDKYRMASNVYQNSLHVPVFAPPLHPSQARR
jgi:hypothetical protein